MIAVILVSWLYTLTFCEVYSFTAYTWLLSGLSSLFVDLIVVNTVKSLVNVSCRFLSKTYQNE
jgi:hypothetical protein